MQAPFVAIIGDRMINEVRAVVRELGGEQTLGRTFSAERDLREAIRDGFPPAVVQELMQAVFGINSLLEAPVAFYWFLPFSPPLKTIV